MFQVFDIIHCQPFDRVQIARVTSSCSHVIISISENGYDLVVLQVPELDQFFKPGVLVVVDTHPVVLPVNNFWIVVILCNNKAAQVVLRGIDKVAEYFFFAPLIGGGFYGGR